jgi:hypothetical protein
MPDDAPVTKARGRVLEAILESPHIWKGSNAAIPVYMMEGSKFYASVSAGILEAREGLMALIVRISAFMGRLTWEVGLYVRAVVSPCALEIVTSDGSFSIMRPIINRIFIISEKLKKQEYGRKEP